MLCSWPNPRRGPVRSLGPIRSIRAVTRTHFSHCTSVFVHDQCLPAPHRARSLSCQTIDSHPVWVADIDAMGAVVHQDIPVVEILRRFEEALRANAPTGIPLVFCPRRQIACDRAKNQAAIYIAQMDLRCDLAEIWRRMESERQGSETVVLKLILPKGTEEECTRWLEANGIDEAFIYPDREDECPNIASQQDCRHASRSGNR